MKVMQKPEPNLRYGSVSGALRLGVRRKTFWSLPLFDRKMHRKSPKCQGHWQCESGPANHVISRPYQSLSAPPINFQQQLISTSPVLRDKILKKN